MKVVVAVLSYNRLELWRRTIDSLYRTNYPFELVLFDGGSIDGTEKEVAALGGVCNDSENHWIGHEFRESVKLAMAHEPDLIVFSADDYEYREGWLEELVACWETEVASVIGIIGCAVSPLFRWNNIFNGVSNMLIRDTVPGSNWSFKPELWPTLDPLIPDDKHKYDKAVCRRLRQARGLLSAEIDVAEHTGEGRRMWTDEPEPVGKIIDKAQWGVS